jgi:hypothetical protein
MKAASSELTLTIVAIVAIGLVLTLVTTFLGEGGAAEEGIQDQWDNIIDGANDAQ